MYLIDMEKPPEFSKYERARIIGARALQISMDAPILINLDEKELNVLNYDPLKIAEKELDSGVLPISVKRPMPQRKESSLEKIKIYQIKSSDEEKIKVEEVEEKEISEGGEILELANVQEESEEEIDESPREDEE